MNNLLLYNDDKIHISGVVKNILIDVKKTNTHKKTFRVNEPNNSRDKFITLHYYINIGILTKKFKWSILNKD